MTSTQYQPETIYQCPHCEAEVDPDQLGGRVYECQNDGTFVAEEGDGNHCPDCNKFAAKIANQSCPDCGEAIEDGELEEREVYRSADGTAHDTAEEATAWDTPEAVAERADQAAESKASSERIFADVRAEDDRRRARLAAALALPTTPPIAYYDWDGAAMSVTAFITPDEIRAVCGAGTDDEVEARWRDAGGDPVSFWSQSVNVGVPVEVLCTLLEQLAEGAE